ncbi:Rrf2 family transcriptional regulator [Staphylococcus sp. ACRSN]|uniref:Rrf2 family transcriptional regulator n=1 Tax=Staphylococcus sp. ACRSN TaxID=2918214 RepID=UPI001EF2328F|nr:Rrf2 family transcriptional regulator [Staphylococcus sp. ACRSN]MCG7339245.1 Rrf2 family transcriptional regulator [Staphylococcus sp. ACRSN]
MDSKFSVAIHTLVMVSEYTSTINSEDIANSVKTNSSYIRKIVALLKKANIIKTYQGKSGIILNIPKNELTLLDIYIAVQPENKKLLDVHKEANQNCPVGKHIENVLIPAFDNIEEQFYKYLKNKTLEDIINEILNKQPSI